MQLVIISIARAAPSEIVKDIIRALETGEAYTKFRSEWLDTSKAQFHDNISSKQAKDIQLTF